MIYEHESHNSLCLTTEEPFSKRLTKEVLPTYNSGKHKQAFKALELANKKIALSTKRISQIIYREKLKIACPNMTRNDINQILIKIIQENSNLMIESEINNGIPKI